MVRGEVWWYEPPGEPRRPYLILTRDEAIPVLHSLVAVPTTRRVRRIPTEVELDRSDGMPTSCALTLDNVNLVDAAYLIDRITSLSPERMHQVCRALGHATGCTLGPVR